MILPTGLKHPFSFALLCALPFCAMAEEIKIQPTDFSVGYTLHVDEVGTQAKLKIPTNLYSSLRTENLSDLALFNQNGQNLPHQIQKIPEKTTRDTLIIPKAFYCNYEKPKKQSHYQNNSMELYWQQEGKLSLRLNPQQEIKISPKSNSIECLVEIQSSPTKEAPHREEKTQTQQILLEWKTAKPLQNTETFLISSAVEIQHSADLLHWQSMGSPQNIEEVKQGQFYAIQNTLKIPQSSAQKLHYLKLIIKQSELPILIESVKHQEVTTTKTTYWDQPYLSPVEKDSASFYYKLNGPRLIEKLQIQIPENRWYESELLCKTFKDTAYFSVWKGKAYNIKDSIQKGKWNKNQALDFSKTPSLEKFRRCSDWKLSIQGGTDPFPHSPSIEFFIAEEELQFVTNGQQEFTLAVGRHPAHGAIHTPPMPKIPAEFADAFLRTSSFPLGGEDFLNPPHKVNYGWVLWASLLVFLGILIFMARTLIHDLKKG